LIGGGRPGKLREPTGGVLFGRATEEEVGVTGGCIIRERRDATKGTLAATINR
jgi:hypothetical protein